MAKKRFDPIRLKAELTRLLETLAARSVLCAGERAETLLARALPPSHSISVCRLPLEQIPECLETLPHVDLAYVHGAVERLPRPLAGMLLARLRDVSARRLLVHVEIGLGWSGHLSDWENNDLLAFGLVKAGEYQMGDCRAHIYQFNILDYKLTPDWFSAEHWAHPHLWKP